MAKATGTAEKRRGRRTRAKIGAFSDRPRLSVFKSNKAVYAQVIDDEKNVTLASASAKASELGGMRAAAARVGEEISKAAAAKGVKEVVFDRGRYQYTGVVKELAEKARAGGIEF